jgi:hypothetical protein
MAWPAPPSSATLPVRGSWELPGNSQALWVAGKGLYLMTVDVGATGTSRSKFNVQQVGTLKTSEGRVIMRDNGPGGTVAIVDGPYGYFYDIASQTLTNITDPAFLGATHVAFIDGWWIFNKPGSQIFYVTVPQYTTTFDGSYYALKDAATDLLVGLMENKQELWLIGEKTTEIWYDAGGEYRALLDSSLRFGGFWPRLAGAERAGPECRCCHAVIPGGGDLELCGQ